MKSEKLELVRGSGNEFRDLGHQNERLILIFEAIASWPSI
jgi:hypothetical protein